MINIFETQSALGTSEGLVHFFKLHEKTLKTALVILVLLLSCIALFKYTSLKIELQKLSKHETILVLAAKEDLNIGDKLTSKNLALVPFSKSTIHEVEDKLESKVFFTIEDKNNFASVLYGKTLKYPVLAGGILRHEFIKNPLEISLSKFIPINHSLFEMNISNTGANQYIDIGNIVSLYGTKSGKLSTKISSRAKVLLINSKRDSNSVKSDAKTLHLTLAVPNSEIKNALAAKAGKKIELILENAIKQRSYSPVSRKGFQPLVISTNKKKVVYQ